MNFRLVALGLDEVNFRLNGKIAKNPEIWQNVCFQYIYIFLDEMKKITMKIESIGRFDKTRTYDPLSILLFSFSYS